MADIFIREDTKKLLRGKNILFMGDSNTRAVYKDLVWLIKKATLVPADRFKSKLEISFLGDSLIERGAVTKGRDYRESREFRESDININYIFITRCYNSYVETIFKKDLSNGKIPTPDVIVLNSCLWDISRWGPRGVDEYKDNLILLMRMFQKVLPDDTLVIWTTMLPLSQMCRGGFLIKQVEFLKYTLRFDVMEANHYARQVVAAHGFDVLDFHFYLQMQLHRRCNDGIHWMPAAIRHMTNLVLTHIALAWDVPLPGRFKASIVESAIQLAQIDENATFCVPELPKFVPNDVKTEASSRRKERDIKHYSERRRRVKTEQETQIRSIIFGNKKLMLEKSEAGKKIICSNSACSMDKGLRQGTEVKTEEVAEDSHVKLQRKNNTAADGQKTKMQINVTCGNRTQGVTAGTTGAQDLSTSSSLQPKGTSNQIRHSGQLKKGKKSKKRKRSNGIRLWEDSAASRTVNSWEDSDSCPNQNLQANYYPYVQQYEASHCSVRNTHKYRGNRYNPYQQP